MTPSQPANQISTVPRTRLSLSDPSHSALIVRRQKQIDLGKCTAGYTGYRDAVRKGDRRSRDPEQPNTPDVMEGMSNRTWNGYVSAWRRALHLYDPSKVGGEGDGGGEAEREEEKRREKERRLREMRERREGVERDRAEKRKEEDEREERGRTRELHEILGGQLEEEEVEGRGLREGQWDNEGEGEEPEGNFGDEGETEARSDSDSDDELL